jgi:hypothetical protein
MKNARKHSLKVLTLSIALLTSVNSYASSLQIEKIVQAGSGCEAKELQRSEDYYLFGSWILIRPDSAFVAQSGQGVPLREMRKNCQINIRFSPMKGAGVGIDSVYELLEAEIIGDVVAKVAMDGSIQGSADTQTSETVNTASDLDEGSLFVKHSFEDLASCENAKSINLNSSLRLTPSRYTDISTLAKRSYLFIKTSKGLCDATVD